MTVTERCDKYCKGALSAKSIKNHVSFISSIYEYAIKQGVISYNPCKVATLPKEKEKELKIYSISDTRKILELLYREDDNEFHFALYFILAIFTGFRRGELLGLEWKDIDFERQTISLNRTSLYTKAKGMYTSSPKTRTSYRTLKVPAELLDLLNGYRKRQRKYIKSVGDKWVGQIKGLNDEMVDNDRLFTTWNGAPMSPPTPSKYFKRLCKDNGIEYRKGHSLRHFNASVQIHAGVDVKTVSANLGHSLCSTTLNIYCKQFQMAQAASMEKIVGVLGLPSARAV